MYGFIYIWRDAKRNDRRNVKFYIGRHWGTEDDGYICSSTIMKKNYKRRPIDFKRRIIKKVSTYDQLIIEEQRYLNMIKPEEFGVKYYNKSKNASSPRIIWTEEERKKQSEITKKAMQRPDVRKKYLKGIKNRVTTNWKNPEARALKISEVKRKKFQERRDQGLNSFSDTAIINMAKGRKNKNFSYITEEFRQQKRIQAYKKKDPISGKFTKNGT